MIPKTHFTQNVTRSLLCGSVSQFTRHKMNNIMSKLKCWITQTKKKKKKEKENTNTNATVFTIGVLDHDMYVVIWRQMI